MEDIDKIIASSSLVLQRVLSVKMVLKGYSYGEITDLLGVSPSFIEKWRALYSLSFWDIKKNYYF